MINLKNKKVIITGSTGGIGNSLVKKFHDNGSLITTIYVIVREGDRENGKCGHPLEFPLSEARPATSDDPTQMKLQVMKILSMKTLKISSLKSAMLVPKYYLLSLKTPVSCTIMFRKASYVEASL